MNKQPKSRHEQLFNEIFALSKSHTDLNEIKRLVTLYDQVDRVEPNTLKLSFLLNLHPQPHYEFAGRRALEVSGFEAQHYIEKGMPALLDRIHPDDLDFTSESSLKISFVYDEQAVNGRTMGLSGEYVFILDSE
jgi:hypothetical protein